ncbi:putative adhesion protein FadA [Fusobacterium varium]|nr:putative adhesion protein FadA [Fusobacterium varium]
MQIKKSILLGLGAILISTNLAAADVTLDSKFSQLEAELKMLEQKENERFKQEEMIAKTAQANLNLLTTLKGKSNERTQMLMNMEGKSIYNEEVKKILKQYQVFVSDIDKQVKIEERKVFEFNQLKSLR